MTDNVLICCHADAKRFYGYIYAYVYVPMDIKPVCRLLLFTIYINHGKITKNNNKHFHKIRNEDVHFQGCESTHHLHPKNDTFCCQQENMLQKVLLLLAVSHLAISFFLLYTFLHTNEYPLCLDFDLFVDQWYKGHEYEVN